MITLQDFFDDLAAGELANVKMGNSDLGTISEAEVPKVVSCLNQAFLKVYQRLNLRQGKLILHQQSGVTRYFLRSKYAGLVGDIDEDIYLQQTDLVPYEDDLIKVLSAEDSDDKEVRINDRKYPADIFTSSFDVVDIAAPSSSSTYTNTDGVNRTSLDIFTIEYQAKFPKIIVTENLKPRRYELHIPDFIIDPLLLYTTYKLFRKPVKIAKGEVNPSTTLLVEFENSMRQLENQDLEMDTNDTNTRIEDNGWK